MKKIILIIFGILFLAAGLVFWKINKDYYAVWDCNSISVTADKPLTVEKVKIEFGISANTINRINDSALFINRDKYTVLFDGTPEDKMINDYGENDFLITYDNKYYFSFRQFKRNKNHQHYYNFHFVKKNDTVFVRADIHGKDNMKFERPMNAISMASRLKCNSAIDKNKIIYNMVELVNPDNK